VKSFKVWTFKKTDEEYGKIRRLEHIASTGEKSAHTHELKRREHLKCPNVCHGIIIIIIIIIIY
jgi:hypothetical protein